MLTVQDGAQLRGERVRGGHCASCQQATLYGRCTNPSCPGGAIKATPGEGDMLRKTFDDDADNDLRKGS